MMKPANSQGAMVSFDDGRHPKPCHQSRDIFNSGGTLWQPNLHENHSKSPPHKATVLVLSPKMSTLGDVPYLAVGSTTPQRNPRNLSKMATKVGFHPPRLCCLAPRRYLLDLTSRLSREQSERSDNLLERGEERWDERLHEMKPTAIFFLLFFNFM